MYVSACLHTHTHIYTYTYANIKIYVYVYRLYYNVIYYIVENSNINVLHIFVTEYN